MTRPSPVARRNAIVCGACAERLRRPPSHARRSSSPIHSAGVRAPHRPRRDDCLPVQTTTPVARITSMRVSERVTNGPFGLPGEIPEPTGNATALLRSYIHRRRWALSNRQGAQVFVGDRQGCMITQDGSGVGFSLTRVLVDESPDVRFLVAPADERVRIGIPERTSSNRRDVQLAACGHERAAPDGVQPWPEQRSPSRDPGRRSGVPRSSSLHAMRAGTERAEPSDRGGSRSAGRPTCRR